MLSLSQQALSEDAGFQTLISQLDTNTLDQTLSLARAAYETRMDAFHKVLEQHYGLARTSMSAYTLGNWVVGYAQFPNAVGNLTHLHRRLPVGAIVELLPDMLAVLGEMPQGREAWQHALAVMTLPLLAKDA